MLDDYKASFGLFFKIDDEETNDVTAGSGSLTELN